MSSMLGFQCRIFGNPGFTSRDLKYRENCLKAVYTIARRFSSTLPFLFPGLSSVALLGFFTHTSAIISSQATHGHPLGVTQLTL